MAFVQCVGSRDAKLGHLWCSKVCCASALRMARLIKKRRPETEVTFFYIDVQTFGQEFQRFYDDVRKEVHMIRAIPGDVYRTPDDRLTVVYYDFYTEQSREEPYDMLVLSIGITPADDARDLAAKVNLPTRSSGFLPVTANGGNPEFPGVFAAGTVCGPMSIAESVADGDRAAQAAAAYLHGNVRAEVHS
jgi:heterodisulfide reductase subunit A